MTDVWPWLPPALIALIDWTAVVRNDRRTEVWAKPATLVALIGTALALGAPHHAGGWWLLVALAFGLLGDVMLLGSSTARFQAGLGAFLIGHLAYVVCFVILGLDRPGWGWVGLAIVAVAMAATRRVLPTVHRQEGAALSAPVAIYMLVIGAMAVTGWATGRPWVALGASIFVASDAILASDRFVTPRPWARPAIMVTYHLGQALIVLGVLH